LIFPRSTLVHTRVECGKSKYPNEQEIADIDKGREWVPETLDRFMRQLVSSDVKIISISQCIIQAARPRTIITPILFGFGVQLEKTFGSKWLVNHLSKLGFSIIADEVLRFKQSAVQNMDTVYGEQTQDSQDQVFAKLVADNVDHNTATLSGKGTFHGMGIICSSDKPLGGYFANIPRLKQRKKADTFVEKRGIEIIPYYKSSEIGQKKLNLSPFQQLLSVITIPTEVNYDFIWHCGWFIMLKVSQGQIGLVSCSVQPVYLKTTNAIQLFNCYQSSTLAHQVKHAFIQRFYLSSTKQKRLVLIHRV